MASNKKNKNKIQRYYETTVIQINSPYEPEYREHGGRQYIVVPVVMMLEGVHHGSAGAVFHPAEELSKFPGAWNGIPLTINHPDTDISPTGSANIPQLAEEAVVGRVYNTDWIDEKLKAEAWFDAERLQAVSAATFEKISNKQPIDVSVGVFTDDDMQTGEWNGESYVSISRNHRPDHLAVLPHSDGACSWRKGCGVRTNEQGKEDAMDEKKINVDVIINNMATGHEEVNLNEEGFRELISTIQGKLDAMDTDTAVHYLDEVYNDYFVYHVNTRNENAPALHYRRDYTMNEDGTVDFGTEPVQVVRKVSFETVNSNQNMGVEEMEETKGCCEGKVLLLVESGAFAEEDTEALGTLPENIVDKIVDLNAKATVKPDGEPETQNNTFTPKDAVQVLKDHIKTPEQFIGFAPEGIQAMLRHSIKLHARYRAELEAKVLKYAGDAYTEDEIKTMEDAPLEKLAKALKANVTTDYSVFASGTETQANASGPAPLPPAGVESE